MLIKAVTTATKQGDTPIEKSTFRRLDYKRRPILVWSTRIFWEQVFTA